MDICMMDASTRSWYFCRIFSMAAALSWSWRSFLSVSAPVSPILPYSRRSRCKPKQMDEISTSRMSFSEISSIFFSSSLFSCAYKPFTQNRRACKIRPPVWASSVETAGSCPKNVSAFARIRTFSSRFFGCISSRCTDRRISSFRSSPAAGCRLFSDKRCARQRPAKQLLSR